MPQPLTLNGVPDKIAMDAWWLASSGAPTEQARPAPTAFSARSGAHTPPGFPRIVLGLAVLVPAADILFWDHRMGLSLAVFAALIFAVTAWGLPRRQVWRPALLLTAGAMPVLDYVQALSVAILGAALLFALVWTRIPDARANARIGAALLLLSSLPAQWTAPFLAPLRKRSVMPAAATPMLRQSLRNWAFPIGGGMVLAALLLDANPVLSRLILQDFDLAMLFERALFWGGIALLVWPLVSPTPVPRNMRLPDAPRLRGLGLNEGSVLRALLMFNLMIGAQTLMDASIFIGGTDLPLGMTYASYAHRGAYPLLVTALLAGAFALAARPFLDSHRAMRPLMQLWLGQNVVLCASAMLRAQAYIEQYGLTYLRLHALIWMALVATGLMLTAWQVAHARPMEWLLKRVAILGIGTLYVASLVNFAGVIATHNLKADKNDSDYLCQLGPTAAAAFAASGRDETDLPDTYRCDLHAPAWDGWQEWGFRNWRVARYVARVQDLIAETEEVAAE